MASPAACAFAAVSRCPSSWMCVLSAFWLPLHEGDSAADELKNFLQQPGCCELQTGHELADIRSPGKNCPEAACCVLGTLRFAAVWAQLNSMSRSAESCVAILQPSFPQPSTSTSESSQALCQRWPR